MRRYTCRSLPCARFSPGAASGHSRHTHWRRVLYEAEVQQAQLEKPAQLDTIEERAEESASPKLFLLCFKSSFLNLSSVMGLCPLWTKASAAT
jgi:hypothetical protein